MVHGHVSLEGAVNFRDFGGQLTQDGRKVRTGRLFRSGTLTHLTQAAHRKFRELDVQLICDLRRPDERQHEATRLPRNRPRRIAVPILVGQPADFRDLFDGAAAKAEHYIRFMIDLNRRLATAHRESFARMFKALVGLERGAFLVHCSSGKDRTGFACMLILHALGVPRESILADYLRTNQLLSFEEYFLPHLERFNHAIPGDRSALLPLGTVRPEYLAAAYQAIEADSGCIEVYLEQALGLNAANRRRLQSAFLE